MLSQPESDRALFGLQDEATALVEVDAARTGRAVAVVEGHAPLEDVGVVPIVGRGGFRARRVEEIAEFGQKELAVGPLRRPGGFPAFYEGFDVFPARARMIGFSGQIPSPSIHGCRSQTGLAREVPR